MKLKNVMAIAVIGMMLATAFSGCLGGEKPTGGEGIPPTQQEGKGWITGTVTDKEGDPIEGVLVKINETKQSTETNENGEYKIENIEPGTYNIAAEKEGFSPIAKTVKIIAGQATEVNFELEPAKVQVAVYYDDRYPTSWLTKQEANTIAIGIIEKLESKSICAEIVNADELKIFMNENPTGCVVMCMGAAPDTIWDGSEDSSLVEKWLDNGGRMAWTGDWPFFHISNADGTLKKVDAKGSEYVFDFQPISKARWYVEYYEVGMTPTDVGKKVLPSLHEFNAARPVDIKAVEDNSPNYEFYATGNPEPTGLLVGPASDPCAFSPKGGTGIFGWVALRNSTEDADAGLSIQDRINWLSELTLNKFLKP